MEDQRDYYEVLGVSKNADAAEIKKAYKRLAMKYHPDRNTSGDEETEHKFKEAKEAYEVLSSADKRAAYDQFGHAGVNQQGGGFGGGGFGDAFSDIFGDIFGGGRRGRSRVFRGADLRYELDLDLEQAAFGDTVTITIPVMSECGGRATPSSSTLSRSTAAATSAASRGLLSVRSTTGRRQSSVRTSLSNSRSFRACWLWGPRQSCSRPPRRCGPASRCRCENRLRRRAAQRLPVRRKQPRSGNCRERSPSSSSVATPLRVVAGR